jgi:hypothetical protein
MTAGTRMAGVGVLADAGFFFGSGTNGVPSGGPVTVAPVSVATTPGTTASIAHPSREGCRLTDRDILAIFVATRR